MDGDVTSLPCEYGASGVDGPSLTSLDHVFVFICIHTHFTFTFFILVHQLGRPSAPTQIYLP